MFSGTRSIFVLFFDVIFLFFLFFFFKILNLGNIFENFDPKKMNFHKKSLFPPSKMDFLTHFHSRNYTFIYIHSFD